MPPEHPRYALTLAVRSAGILQGDAENNCDLDGPLTIKAANAMVGRTEEDLQASAGWTPLEGEGYVTRSRVAEPLLALMAGTTEVTAQVLSVTWDGAGDTLAVYADGADYYVTPDMLGRLLDRVESGPAMEKTVPIRYGDRVAEMTAVMVGGAPCGRLEEIAALLGLDMRW